MESFHAINQKLNNSTVVEKHVMQLINRIMAEEELGNWKANIFSLQGQSWQPVVNSAPFGLYRNQADNTVVRIVCPNSKPSDPVCAFILYISYIHYLLAILK